MARSSGCPFERYADDAVVRSKEQAAGEYVRARFRANGGGGAAAPSRQDEDRLLQGSNRREEPERISFTFLGDAFRPREARAQGRQAVHVVLAAVSPEALKAESDQLPALQIHRRTDLSLNDLRDG